MHWRRGIAQLDAQLLGPWLKDEAFTFYIEKLFFCQDFYHKLQWIDASAFKKNAMKNMHNSSSQHLVPPWNSNPGVTVGPCMDSHYEESSKAAQQ